MKVLVCLFLAIHLAVADVCVKKALKDADLSSRGGIWYNYARVAHRPGDEHAKCEYFEMSEEVGVFKFMRYEVDDRTEKEDEAHGTLKIDFENDKSIITFDGSDIEFEGKILCMADTFEIYQYGDAEHNFVYVYTKDMHPSGEIVKQIHDAITSFHYDPHKLILVDQANCPRCTCENKAPHTHHDHAHGHNHDHGSHGDHSHDHAHHHH